MSREPEQNEDELPRQYEGRAKLQKLLESAGTVADVDDVAEAFAQAQKDGVPSSVVITALFDDEPRFESPDDAAALFGNLLGLWDVVAAGETVEAAPKARTPKRPPAPAPGLFPKEGPSLEWLDAAWRHLADAPKKEQQRRAHTFDNRQDVLLSWLDESGLSDLSFSVARLLLAELYAFIELGWEPGLGQVIPEEVDRTGQIPEGLKAWLDDSVFEAEHHEEQPIPADELPALRSVLQQALAAMWRARSSG